jgi:hypothetical protein
MPEYQHMPIQHSAGVEAVTAPGTAKMKAQSESSPVHVCSCEEVRLHSKHGKVNE